MHLAPAIITNSLTKSSATIVSVMAIILRLVTITTNLLLLLLILSLLRRCLPFQLCTSLLDSLSTSPPLHYRTLQLRLFVWLVMHLFPLLSQFYPVSLKLGFFDLAYCNHMTPHLSLFSKLDPAPYPLNIHIADGSTMHGNCLGSISTSNISILGVFHVPYLSYNLFFV